jgi:hypothetical protein
MRYASKRVLALVMLTLLAANVHAADQKWTRELAKGITLTQIVRTPGPKDEGALPQFINVLVVDPKVPGVEVRTILANDKLWGDDPTKGRETVSSMVKRTGAVAGVNGDYADWCGRPDNVFVLNGELFTDPWSRRPVLAIKDDQTYLFDKVIWENKVTTEHGDTYALAGMNKVAEWDELILFTPSFFTTTLSKGSRRQEVVIETTDLPPRPGVPIKGKVVSFNDNGSTPIKPGTVVLSGTVYSAQFVRDKLKPGTAVTITLDLKPKETTGWDKVKYTLGGCPWIVRNGKFWMDAEEEHVVPAFYDVPNPRTAVGRTRDGKLVIVTVDGRQAIAVGMKLSELADVMLSFGCLEAINLDGGGSTEMATPFGILNGPSDGGERATPTALAVYNTKSTVKADPAGFKIVGIPGEMKSGQTAQLSLVDATGKPVPKKLVARAVWSTDGKIGAIDQSGRFYASKAHEGEIRAWIDGRQASAPVKVLAGETNRVSLYYFAASKDTPNVQKLGIYTRDLNANPLQFQKVKITVTGGTADKTDVTTNDDGAAFVNITWTPDFQGTQQVEARCGDKSNKAERPKKSE